MNKICTSVVALAIVCAAETSLAQQGESSTLEERLRAIEENASFEIRALKAENERLKRDLEALARKVSEMSPPGPAGPQPQNVAKTSTKRPEPLKPTTPPPEQKNVPQQVGEAPKKEVIDQPDTLFANIGGILTPKGRLFGETAINYTTSSDNRFFFSGVEIIDALIIGAIEARDTDRTSIAVSQTLRYGLTPRLEIDATVPFVQQYDR
ncbi:MAG: hypothetical protein V2I43_07430, partial [Parvularcula sp.]|nr:hypothetical protein [Parvularcula sp.]